MHAKDYMSSLNKEKQQKLDSLIAKYAVYSGGFMYSDIIVPRDCFIEFVNSLTNVGVIVDSVSWWCYATTENKIKSGCPHGYGGPMTKVGWFSELSHEFDELIETAPDLFQRLDSGFNMSMVKDINNKSIALIQNKKTATYADGTILTFQTSSCLTPGFNLFVPQDWRMKMIGE